MDTTRLRYFCTVCQTVNIHRAAELLGISPAALSKAIKLLESELGVALLIPSGRGIAITDQGKVFAARAQVLLKEFEQLRASAKNAEAKRDVLRVGSFEVFTTHCLWPLLKDYLSDTESDLVLHELGPGKLEEALVDNRLDIGITYVPIPHPDLDFLKAATLTMGAFSRKGAWTSKTLSDIPFAVPVTPLQGSPTKVVGLDGWPDNLVPRNIRFRVTLMESAIELCRQGVAAAFLPKFVVELHNLKAKETFHLHPYPHPLPLTAKYLQQPVYLVKRKSDLETQPFKRMAKALRLLCQ